MKTGEKQKLTDKKEVIAALKASLDNDDYVDTTKLNHNDWINILTCKLQDHFTDAHSILNAAARIMALNHISPYNIARVISDIGQIFPKKMSISEIPFPYKQYMIDTLKFWNK